MKLNTPKTGIRSSMFSLTINKTLVMMVDQFQRFLINQGEVIFIFKGYKL